MHRTDGKKNRQDRNTLKARRYGQGLLAASAASSLLGWAASAEAKTSGQYTLTATVTGAKNIRSGGSTAVTATINNTGSGGQDSLNFTGLTATSSSGGTITGSSTSGNGLATGASSNNTGLSFTSSTPGAYTLTPTATVSNNSVGGSPTKNGTTNDTVSVFAFASPTLGTASPVAFGNVHVGATQNVSITDTLTAGSASFQDSLDVTGSGVGAITAATGFNVAAGATKNLVLTATTAGSLAGTETLGYTSDANGVSGLSNATLTSGSISITGNAYNLAAANTIATPVTLTNVHVGSAFGTSALTLQNTAAAGSFSEKLDASFGALTGHATTNSGSISLLAGQGTNTTSMVVGLGSGTQSTAGAVTGTAVINLTSDGTGTSGLANTTLAAQTITINGGVYRLAAANTIATPVTLANVHVGSAFGTSALSIQNTAANDGYSEKLDASFGALTGSASTNGGSISTLAAQATNGTAMTVGLGSGAQNTAGTISGTAVVNLTSDGTGTSGLANTTLAAQTVSVTGGVYRLATANTIATPVNLGNVHVNGTFGTSALNIQNTQVNDAFSEKLDAAFGTVTGSASDNGGSISLLSAGSANGSAMTVGLGGNAHTATAGSVTGTVPLSLTSDGTGTSGLGTTALAGQTVTVQGGVYRLAAANTIATPLALTNIHVGGTFTNKPLSVQNTAASDGYSEKLDAAFGTITGSASTNGAAISLLAPGSTDASTMTLGLGSATQNTAGAVSGTAVVGLTSDGTGTSGLANTALSGQTVSVTGGVYNLAAANTIATPVNLGNIHAGGTFGTSALTIQNTAASGSFSEKLDASFGTLTGSASTNGGSITTLAAQATNSSSMVVGLGGGAQNAAGAVTGTAVINLTSDGTGTSGLANTPLSSQTVSVSGTVYRLAAANTITTPVSLGNVHVGGTFGTSALNLQNTAASDGFSEKLDAAFGTLAGSASTNGGSVGLLAAGSTNNSSMVVGLGSGTQNTAGAISGTVGVTLTSDGSGTSGLGTTSLAGQTVSLTGGVYRLATANTITTPVAFAPRFVGSAASQSLSVQNTQTNDAFSEKLDAAFGTVGSGLTTNGGSVSLLAPGSTNASAMAVGIDTTTAGHKAGSVAISLTSDGTGTSGLANTALAGQTIAVSGDVYDHALVTVNSTPINLRLTQGQTASGSFTLADTGATRDSATVSALNVTGGGFASNFTPSVTIASNGATASYNATYTSTPTSAASGTYDFTYGDQHAYVGQQTNNHAQLQVNAQVDALAEHVSSTSGIAPDRTAGGSLGTANVTKVSNGNYTPGYVTNLGGGAGVNKGYVTVNVTGGSGSFGPDTPVFLLDFGGHTVAGLTALETDLKAFGYSVHDFNGDGTGQLNRFVVPNTTRAFDLEIDGLTATTTNPTYFDFNFSNYNAGNLLVSNIAVVPEPTSLGFFALGGLAFLPRWRRRHAAR